MIDLFARRSKVATRAIGIADVLTPVQVRVFSDCEMRWFYEHLLAVPDPPTASMALGGAIRAALITNFRHKLQCKEDLQTEAVVDLFRRAWQKQQQAAFCDDEHPDRIGGIGEELVRIYMRQRVPGSHPHLRTLCLSVVCPSRFFLCTAEEAKAPSQGIYVSNMPGLQNETETREQTSELSQIGMNRAA